MGGSNGYGLLICFCDTECFEIEKRDTLRVFHYPIEYLYERVNYGHKSNHLQSTS